jgi:hypothetical protein
MCEALTDWDDWGHLQLLWSDPDFAPREVIHCMVDGPALIVRTDNQD